MSSSRAVSYTHLDVYKRQADTLGWHGPYALVHHAEEAVAAAVSVGSGALACLTNTLGSAIAGLIVGAVVVLIMHLIPRRKDCLLYIPRCV